MGGITDPVSGSGAEPTCTALVSKCDSSNDMGDSKRVNRDGDPFNQDPAGRADWTAARIAGNGASSSRLEFTQAKGTEPSGRMTWLAPSTVGCLPVRPCRLPLANSRMPDPIEDGESIEPSESRSVPITWYDSRSSSISRGKSIDRSASKLRAYSTSPVPT